MDSSEAKRLKQLEDENRRLKQVVAELTLMHGAKSKPGGKITTNNDRIVR